jgi:hypothetical protein
LLNVVEVEAALLESKPDKNPGPPGCARPPSSLCKTLTVRNAEERNARLINGGRRRLGKGVRRTEINGSQLLSRPKLI